MRFLSIALILFAFRCYAEVAAEPWPKKLQDFPKSGTLTVRDFKITVRESRSQEGAGTGGRMYDFTVQNTRTGAKRTFTE